MGHPWVSPILEVAMINYKTGNIFYQDVDAIVNPVNCVGVMGAGLALQFKKWYPENFDAYAIACRNFEVWLGKMFVYRLYGDVRPYYIINFPTKYHWRDKSSIEDIDSGLVALVEEIRIWHIQSIAIPRLGCGLGGLHWPDVRSHINMALLPLFDLEAVILGSINGA